MKLTYLGTAAAEGFPAVFCNCEYCCEARRLGGKNIRTRSQTLINDDLLIDFPADTYHHFLTNNIEGDKIKYLLITHSHSDHLYVDELNMRHGCFAHNMRSEKMEVFCSNGAYKKIIKNGVPEGISVTKISPFQEFSFGNYTCIPLPARHMEGDDAVVYIIKSEKTILYLHDTGFLYEEVFKYIEKDKIYFDMVSFDCTNVDIKISKTGTHMDIENIENVIGRLKDIGVIDEKTKMYINHFSHNANPLHHLLEERVRDIGLSVSYDGCEVEI